MELQSFKCPECAYTNDNLDSLRIHCQKRHKLSSQALYVTLFKNGVTPVCECGCGETPRFLTLQNGYTRFVNGHNNRVQNNWGHNKEALEKSQAVRREMWKNGEIVAWHKGKSTKTDERLAKAGKKISATIMANEPDRQRRAENMSRCRLDGTIKAPRGDQHGQWKGGSSAHQALCRSRIHSTWVYPKLLSAKFTCQKCESQKDLCVHHDQERFAEILQKGMEALGEIGDDFEMKSKLAEWVNDYHIQNEVSGIVLCFMCHDEAHSTDTTIHEDHTW